MEYTEEYTQLQMSFQSWASNNSVDGWEFSVQDILLINDSISFFAFGKLPKLKLCLLGPSFSNQIRGYFSLHEIMLFWAYLYLCKIVWFHKSIYPEKLYPIFAATNTLENEKL